MKKNNALFLMTLGIFSFNSFSQDITWPFQALRYCASLSGSYSLGDIEEKENEVCREVICKNESNEEQKRKTLCFPKVVEAPTTNEPEQDSMGGAENIDVPVGLPPLTLDGPPAVEWVERECEGDECEKQTIQGAIETLQKVEVAVSFIGYPLNCDPKTGMVEFDKESPREMDALGRSSRTRDEIAWNEIIEFDKKRTIERDFGFSFANEGVNEIAGTPLDPECDTRREWRFISKDGSKQETYAWVTDEAGSCKTSHRMESMFFMFPRKTRPSIKVEGEELHVTLPTGEKVIYDKKTKIIKSGVLKEGKIDLTKDHRKRGFAPMEYSGTGIVIRSDQRGADPRQNPKGKKVFNAIISQGNKTCEIPRTELWSQNEKHFHFKFSDDQKLLEFINSKCEQKFSLE